MLEEASERLAVATIKALSSMGIDVELVTVEKPDMVSIRDAYDTDIQRDVKKIRALNILEKYGRQDCGITVNTHGDMLPFYHNDFTKKNAITYCHYPIAGYLIDSSRSRLSSYPGDFIPFGHGTRITQWVLPNSKDHLCKNDVKFHSVY